MLRRLLVCASALAMLSVGFPIGVGQAAAVSSSIVISQVYGGGGNSGAFYTNDFIELYNRGTTPVSVAAWSVQYASSAGSTWQRTNLSGTIQPGRFYLVQQAAGAAGQAPLPAPDATGTIAMSATAGKVALVGNQTTIAIGTSCPTGAAIIDFVGYGAGTGGANCFEGTGAAPTLNNTTAALRKGNGSVDTDSNTADFASGPAGPRNAPITDAAPYVLAVSPAASTTGVARSANVTLTLSEPVNLAGSWYSISCAASGGHTATVTGAGSALITLDPTTDFAFGETCTVQITASLVTDVDSNDPPDPLVIGPTWTFATLAEPQPGSVRIHDIQGAVHTSPKIGQTVGNVPGIVTAVRPNGFYLQDPTPDASDATSEGILVFTSSAPSVAIGDSVVVTATVSEFRPGGSSGTTNLTTTELTGPSVVVISSGNSLPAPIVIGPSGRMPPASVIEDDASGDVETSGVFDPASDGIDFWESLEGMVVDLGNVVVVGPSNRFGEISVIPSDGVGVSDRSAHGGVKITASDKHPERVILKCATSTCAMPTNLNVGDRFAANVTGIVDYDFGNFMIQVFASPTRVGGGLQRETTAVTVPHQLAIATFNVENLSPNDPQSKFDTLAALIVDNLRAPDVISLEEVQDNNGAPGSGQCPTVADGVVDAQQTLTKLAAAISTKSGSTVSYSWRSIDPIDCADGGAPGGNIRQVFFFRTDRGLSFVDRAGGTSTAANSVSNTGGLHLQYSPGRIDPMNAAFNSSRKPLAAEFTYDGHHLFVVANHFNSKGGDQPLWGHFQPPVLSSEVQRMQQATIVRDFVGSILGFDANAEVVVLGDLNDFEFSNPVNTLKGAPLYDLIETLPANERYTYVFEGNSQTLDHIMVSAALRSVATTDVVHVNSEFWDQASDHEPQVATLYDPIAPTIAIAPTQVHAATPASSLSCDAAVADQVLGTPTVSDNFPGVTWSRSGIPTGNVFPVDDTTIVYTARDAVGNTATATQIVTVVDATFPVVSAPANASYQVLSEVPAASPGQALASDNCGAPTVTLVESMGTGIGSAADPLIITRVYTATDAAGNSATSVQTITLVDTTAPAFTSVPGDVAAYTGAGASSCSAAVNVGAATANDNSGLVTVTPSGIPVGGVFPVGSTSVTWAAADRAGNVATASQIVTVVDNTPPSLTAPAPIARATATTSAVVADLGTYAASDNCGTASVAITGVPAGNDFPLGVTSLLYTATDAAGNTTTATQTVTIVDDTPPTIAFSGNAGTYAADETVAISCTISDTGSGIDPSKQRCDSANAPAYTFGLGSHTLFAQAVDNAGNRSTAQTSFTVVATSASVCAVTRTLVTKDGVANSLCVKLDAAAASLARGNTKTHESQLAAYVNEVNAQRGKAVSDANAGILVGLAAGL